MSRHDVPGANIHLSLAGVGLTALYFIGTAALQPNPYHRLRLPLTAPG